MLWESLGLWDDPDFPITLLVACANHVCVWHELFWDWTTIALPQIGIQASRPSRNPLLSNLVDLTPALFPPFKSSDSECSGNLADLSCGYRFHHYLSITLALTLTLIGVLQGAETHSTTDAT